MKIKPNHFQSMMGTTQIIRKNDRKLTIRDNTQRFFFPDEWMVFYQALKKKQQFTFHCLMNTGARINEVRHIKVNDIDLDRQNIVLRKTKARNKDGSCKIRIIKISSQFKKYLIAHIKQNKLKGDDYLPIHSTPAANIAMKKTLEKIGIKDYKMFSVHTVRKTLETWLVSRGIEQTVLLKHFGHSMQIALRHYINPDIFSYDDKEMMKQIIGDLYGR